MPVRAWGFKSPLRHSIALSESDLSVSNWSIRLSILWLLSFGPNSLRQMKAPVIVGDMEGRPPFRPIPMKFQEIQVVLPAFSRGSL